MEVLCMKEGTKVLVNLPNEEPYEAIYLRPSSNENLVRVMIEDGDYPRYGFVNKKFIS